MTLPGAVGPVTQVAAGGERSLVLTSTGQLYAFGDNYYGQLGSAANNKTEEPNPTPTLVTLPGASGPVTQVAAGREHSLAVTSTGQLYAFGENYYGQLGNATNNKTEEPNPTPTLVTLPGASGPVTQVAAGDYSLAVTSTGQLYAFGDNQLRPARQRDQQQDGRTEPDAGARDAAGRDRPGDPGRRRAATQPRGDLHRPALRVRRKRLRAAREHGQQQHRRTEPDADARDAAGRRSGHPGRRGRLAQPRGDLHRPAVRLRRKRLRPARERDQKRNEPNPTPTLVTLPGATGAVTQAVAG